LKHVEPPIKQIFNSNGSHDLTHFELYNVNK